MSVKSTRAFADTSLTAVTQWQSAMSSELSLFDTVGHLDHSSSKTERQSTESFLLNNRLALSDAFWAMRNVCVSNGAIRAQGDTQGNTHFFIVHVENVQHTTDRVAMAFSGHFHSIFYLSSIAHLHRSVLRLTIVYRLQETLDSLSALGHRPPLSSPHSL